MADILYKWDAQYLFAGAGIAPATGNDYRIGTPTTVAHTLGGLASAAGRQSDKVDLGANWARAFLVMGAYDLTATPTSGRVDLYWAPSTSSTAGQGNVAGNSGVDAPAPGGALGGITLAEFILQCDPIGSLKCHDGVAVHCGLINPHWVATSRYGQIVLVNNAGSAFAAGNTQHHTVLTSVVDTDGT